MGNGLTPGNSEKLSLQLFERILCVGMVDILLFCTGGK